MNGCVIDLTHVLEEDMPVFPGTKAPLLKEITTFHHFEFREKELSMFSHTGTHMDAPYHLIKDGATLDEIPVDRYLGRITLIDLREEVADYAHKKSCLIPVEILKKYEDDLKNSDFLLMKTGWDQLWGTNDYFEGFPAITKEGAQFLLTCNLKGYGVDAISVDLMETENYEVHKALLSHGLVMIENLTNLEHIKTGDTLIVLPLKIKDSDGSPVRAIALGKECQ